MREYLEADHEKTTLKILYNFGHYKHHNIRFCVARLALKTQNTLHRSVKEVD
jgi:hypothetical protein